MVEVFNLERVINIMDHNYANAYMKTATASLQEHVTLLLHAKTQNIVSGDIIASLQSQNEQLNGKVQELISIINGKDSEINDRNNIQVENNTLRNKAEALNTALSQITDMKKTIHTKDEEIRNLNSLIEQLNEKIRLSENIQITNKPRRKPKIVNPIPEPIPVPETQDF